jgi:hypothetical protein
MLARTVDWRDVAGVFSLGVGYALLVRWTWPFTLDDAYITLRYSRHLAAGHGVVWNVGAAPVEGDTSTLWMLIGAVPHALGVNAVVFVKLISVMATGLVALGIYVYGRHFGSSRPVCLSASGLIAFNPAIALLTVQGMETALAMLLVFFASMATIQFVRTDRLRWMLGLYISVLLAMLTRPGLVVFALGLLPALFVVTRVRYGRRASVRLFLGGVAVLFLPGLLYIHLRLNYFGHPLPNPFYVKGTGEFIYSDGIQKTVDFLQLSLPLAAIGGIVGIRRRHDMIQRLPFVIPLAIGVTTFLLVWLAFDPVQAWFWRYQMPAFPAVLLSLVILIRRFDPLVPDSVGVGGNQTLSRTVCVGLVSVSLLVTPVQFVDDTAYQMDRRPQHDRVATGKALNEVPAASSRRMFVSESGAIPYYSEWKAVDLLGLNNESIAHRGLDEQLLTEYDPDLVMLLVYNEPSLLKRKSGVVASYVGKQEYRVAAVIEKSGGRPTLPTRYHIYLLAPDTKNRQEVVCQLLTMETVEYARRETFVNKAEIDVRPAETTRTECLS